MIKIKIKKIIATVIVTSFLFVTISPAVAIGDTWGTNVGAAMMQTVIEEVKLVLRKTILQTLKKEANKMVRGAVESAISGISGESMVVANYSDFIFGSAQNAAEDKLDDFFSVLQEGVSTSERDMLRNVEQVIGNQLSPGQPQVTLRETVNSNDPIGDVFNQIKGGGVGALISYQFGEYNNSTSAYINAKEEVKRVASQTALSQQTEVIAGSGFNTITNGNKVIPGKISQEIIAAAETMPIQMINNASSLEEVIASFVVSATTSFLKQGIKTISDPSKKSTDKWAKNIGPNAKKILQDKIKKGLTI